jgi:hypothetical protein
MGLWGSKSNKIVEEKQVESTGEINNTVVLAPDQSFNLQNTEIIVFLGIICLIKIIEFIIFLYKTHKKNLKKKYYGHSVHNLNTISQTP